MHVIKNINYIQSIHHQSDKGEGGAPKSPALNRFKIFSSAASFILADASLDELTLSINSRCLSATSCFAFHFFNLISCSATRLSAPCVLPDAALDGADGLNELLIACKVSPASPKIPVPPVVHHRHHQVLQARHLEHTASLISQSLYVMSARMPDAPNDPCRPKVHVLVDGLPEGVC